jgi:hypothetical protein
LLESGDIAPHYVSVLRAEFAADVVDERRRRAATAARLVEADADEGGSRAVIKGHCCSIS